MRPKPLMSILVGDVFIGRKGQNPVSSHAAIFSRGIDEMSQAMLANRPHRASGAQAVHVIEVIEAIDNSDGKAIEIKSKFTPPSPVNLQELAVAE